MGNDILNYITNFLVIGLGVGLLMYLALYVWEELLERLLRINRMHLRIFEYYRNKKSFERWKDSGKSNDGVDKEGAYDLFEHMLDTLWHLQRDKYSIDGIIKEEDDRKIGKEHMEIDRLMRGYLNIKREWDDK